MNSRWVVAFFVVTLVVLPPRLRAQVPDEFTLLKAQFGRIHTIAGRGRTDSDGGNDWLEAYEGGPARAAELSEAHNAQADVFGCVYIADKDAHSIRVVRPDGNIYRTAGTNTAGNGTDEAQPGPDCALSGPNGLHVQPDGTCFIFDAGNQKVRRLGTDGHITTVIHDPGASRLGRGLWVNADGSKVVYASGTEVREWTALSGPRVIGSGFSGGLANLTLDPRGDVVVTDRSAHSVYRLSTDGTKTRVAGNGMASGGGDGSPALETGLEEVRAIAFASTGGYFLGTHRGSDLWYIDTSGIAHLFISGLRNSDPFAGEGSVATSANPVLSEVRAINLTPGGDLIITHSDESTVRIVENISPLRLGPLTIEPPDSTLKVELRWQSAFEGSILQGSLDIAAPNWETVLISGPVPGESAWVSVPATRLARRFFRLLPAKRWPAPSRLRHDDVAVQ